LFLARDDLDRTTGRRDLLLGGRGRTVRLHGELLGELAVAENLDRVDQLRNETEAAEHADVDRRARLEQGLEGGHVDRERLDAVHVLEPALRNAARHGHLTTLERVARAVVAGAGLLALDALTGRLALTRAATTAEPLLLLGRAGVRVEIVERNRVVRHGELSRTRRGIWRGFLVRATE